MLHPLLGLGDNEDILCKRPSISNAELGSFRLSNTADRSHARRSWLRITLDGFSPYFMCCSNQRQKNVPAVVATGGLVPAFAAAFTIT